MLAGIVVSAGKNQYRADPGVRGNGMTSLILFMAVTNCKNRSNPRPKPECGTVPKLLRSRYQRYSSRLRCSSFILATRTS